MERSFSIAANSFHLQFSADGSHCALLTKTGCQIHSFERPLADRQLAEGVRGRIRQCAFSPDNRWLAVSDQDRLAVWDLAGDGPAAVGPGGYHSGLFFSAADELFTSREQGCARWRLEPGTNASSAPRLIKAPLPMVADATSICLVSKALAITSSQGSRLAALGNDPAETGYWAPTTDGVNGVSADGRWLAIFEPFTPVLHIYALPGLAPVAQLTNHLAIRTFDFSPRGDEVAVSTPSAVEIWSTATWQRTGELTNFMGILFTPDPRYLWLTTDFRSAGLYDIRTKAPLLPLPVGTLPLALSPDGRYLAVSVEARRLQVWDLVEVRQRFRELGIDWRSD
jgi:WD40 repeat protein